MADLISRAAAIEAAIDGADDWDGGYSPTREQYIRQHMGNVPTVDAVPVVRCKDCKHRGYLIGKEKKYPDDVCKAQCYDNYYSWIPGDDWYCANGERREDDA